MYALLKCNHVISCDELGCDDVHYCAEDGDDVCGEEIELTVTKETEGGIGRYYQNEVTVVEISEQACKCEHTDFELDQLKEQAINEIG